LANLKSSAKSTRRAQRRAAYNQVFRSTARTYVKKARRLIAEGKFDEAAEAVREAESALDKAASKGVIHTNNAARRKARLVKLLNEATQQG
jgi:small subunit ribosomal protein S20